MVNSSNVAPKEPSWSERRTESFFPQARSRERAGCNTAVKEFSAQLRQKISSHCVNLIEPFLDPLNFKESFLDPLIFKESFPGPLNYRYPWSALPSPPLMQLCLEHVTVMF